MKTVFKYPIVEPPGSAIPMPAGARILTAQIQHGVLCLWAEVDTNEKRVEGRNIEIFGTGHEMPAGNRTYIGTVQMMEGTLIWHIYERTN